MPPKKKKSSTKSSSPNKDTSSKTTSNSSITKGLSSKSSVKHNTISKEVHLRKLKRLTNRTYRNNKKAERDVGDEKSIASYAQSLQKKNEIRNSQRKNKSQRFKTLKTTKHADATAEDEEFFFNELILRSEHNDYVKSKQKEKENNNKSTKKKATTQRVSF